MATLKFKRSAVPGKVPTIADIDLGEVAINTYDGKLYLKKDDGTQSIVDIGAGSGSAGVTSFNSRTGVVSLTSGDVTDALGFTPSAATLLDQLSDVSVSGSGDGDVLVFNAATNQWINEARVSLVDGGNF